MCAAGVLGVGMGVWGGQEAAVLRLPPWLVMCVPVDLCSWLGV